MTKPSFYCRMDAAGSLQECYSQCAECRIAAVKAEQAGEPITRKQAAALVRKAFEKESP